MVNEYLRYRIPSEMQEKFLADYAAACEHLRDSSVCQGYDLSQCEEEPDCFILRIEWTSTADHLNVFRGSEQFRKFLPLVRPYIPHMEEMRHYAPAGLRWQRP
jgi:quinol monooxygenase YgiN